MSRFCLAFLILTTGCSLSEPRRSGDEEAAGRSEIREKSLLSKSTSKKERSRGVRCECSRVVDGDTIVISRGGKKERVRLLRIDTPEKGERNYEEAKRALASFVSGKELRLVYEEPGHEERDAYGRLLAYVFVGDTFVNAEMIRGGWSGFETGFGRGRFAEELIAAEQYSRRGSPSR